MRGFGEAVNGNWQQAIPFIERWMKYNPETGFGLRMMAMLYANAGRIEEARATLEKGVRGWPSIMKNVRFVMSFWPLKNETALAGFADGYLKAGLSGDPADIYRISEDNRLVAEDLRRLFFGRKVSGHTLATGKRWWLERRVDGSATFREGDKMSTGKSWIEHDMLCDQWNDLHEGLKDCWVIYQNPDGYPERHDEYLGAPGYGIYPFSLADE